MSVVFVDTRGSSGGGGANACASFVTCGSGARPAR